ncbi:hypothetical protein BOVATA_036970 [Babesia ovata]|uniref:Uncharacterized protein n=1 Tax=Babesia ovata TaxID=189622 RepID=A0A2H6KGU4_9APIC|nr:uncharacterized protein BOVATA_036970 [Babesia ovata]GBE62204.1 hypothetical protein BOVATA_036970 [Babesia ovata]
MFANSRQWCENRFNEAAVNAVRNCRLIVRGNVPCTLSLTSGTHKEIRECNSPQYLVNKRLMLLALVDNASSLSCSIEDPAVCNAFNDVLVGKHVDWKRAELRGCLGQVPENLDKFKDRGTSSDLYKYLMLYAHHRVRRHHLPAQEPCGKRCIEVHATSNALVVNKYGN